MSRFDSLNLLSVPMPDAVVVPSQDTILSERMADFVARMEAQGLTYDVDMLDSDPVKVDQEVSTLREALVDARINDAVRAVYLASAENADLDNFVADFNLKRKAGESDASLRQRRLVAPEALSTAGPGGAYDFHILDVGAGLIVDTIQYGPEDLIFDGATPFSGAGIVASVYLPSLDNTVSTDVISRQIATCLNSYSIFKAGVETVVFDKSLQAAQDKRPLSDCHKVRAADIVDYTIEVQIAVPSGPDPSIVYGTVESRLTQLAAALYALNTGVACQLLEGASVVFDDAGAPLVTKLNLVSPAADLPPLPLGAYRNVGVSVSALVVS